MMTMPRAWVQGYEWANSKGQAAELDCSEAIEVLGYDLDSEEAEVFTNGADQAFGEME